MTARSTIRVLTVLLLLALRASPALAGGNQPYIVKDIRPGWMGSGPTSMHKIGDRLFFNADDGVHGQELWVSDGSGQGTYMVLDLVPGSDGSVPQWFMEDLQGVAIFQADNNDDGFDVYRSDGTASGTTWVGEVNDGDDPIPNGTCTFSVYYFELMGDAVYFIGKNPTNQEALWKTNGTPAGTVKLKDVNINEFEAVGETLFFVGSAPGQTIPGFDLWKSDGTPAGTIRLKDLSGVINLTESNGRVFFEAEAQELSSDAELWVSDGTPGGTVLVEDINPGPNPSTPSQMTDMHGVLYFTAFSAGFGRELWRSDGTETGTFMLIELGPGATSSGIYELENVGDTLFFGRFDSVQGWQLWKTDGTTEGTQLIKTISPPTIDSLHAPSQFFVANNKLFFSADDGVHGEELWTSNGEEWGTLMVADTDPGPEGISPGDFVVIGPLVYFSGGIGDYGNELLAFNSSVPIIPAVSSFGPIIFAFGIIFCAAILFRFRNRGTLNTQLKGNKGQAPLLGTTGG